MKQYVLIVAGGKGLRMGGDLPKQFIPIAGKPVLMHTLEAFHRWNAEAELILVLPKDHQEYWRMLCREIGCNVVHQIADGGETRFHSVLSGLNLIREERERLSLDGPAFVAVHDGVRPFVSSEVIEGCFAEAERTGAVVPVMPMIDSLRELFDGYSKPVDRSRFVAVQTPQVFDLDILLKAYQQPYENRYTDDASVVEAMGHKVATVPGNRENIKLTTPLDLEIAKVLLEK